MMVELYLYLEKSLGDSIYIGVFLAFIIHKMFQIEISIAYYNHVNTISNFNFNLKFIGSIEPFDIQQNLFILHLLQRAL